MRVSINVSLLVNLVVLKFVIASVHIQHHYRLGDTYTYAENKSTTTTDLLTGEINTQLEQSVYIIRIVELDDPLTNSSAEYEKTYISARFTPADDRATRRLLSQHTREYFYKETEFSLPEYSIGNRWLMKSATNLDKLVTVTDIYESDEYDTEVIQFDIEIIGTIQSFNETIPNHYWIRKHLDLQTGMLLSEEITHKSTVIYSRLTDVTLKKLIKYQTHHHDL
ncbi:unnamed protein product [Adineta ricciae]|uniref:Uncharacterized protein n=1 Tax=Adineta ricciae TaxID=249248 RepID=A0A815DPY6_ADIRI|nr:unnamed protein product [Adineta ricciae]